MQHGARYSEFLFHAVAPGSGGLLPPFPQTEGLEHFLDPGVALALTHIPDASVKLEIVLSRKALVEARMFEQCTATQADIVGMPDRVEAENLGTAGRRFKQSQQHTDCRGLSGPVRAKEAEDNAFGNVDGESVDGSLGLESSCQRVGSNDRFGH